MMQFPIEETARAIQTILAPAVMISASGLLLLGMQNRYGRINDRLRVLAHERLDLLPSVRRRGPKRAWRRLSGRYPIWREISISARAVTLEIEEITKV